VLTNNFGPGDDRVIESHGTAPAQPAGRSKGPSRKVAASEESKRRSVSPPIDSRNSRFPKPYVEPLSNARTPLADFCNSPLVVLEPVMTVIKHA